MTHTTNTHIYLLLDRSGSMESIRPAVIGGVNASVAEQAAQGADAKLSLVQFDTVDVADVVYDRVPIQRVAPLTFNTFVPRGGTPLLDATGRLIAHAAGYRAQRAARGKRPEEIVIVTVTDGEENSSHELTSGDIERLVAAKEADGWSFVFLSAGLDAYQEAVAIGYDARSVQAWAPDATGSEAAFASLSLAMEKKREYVRAGVCFDRQDFFEGEKAAEADKEARSK